MSLNVSAKFQGYGSLYQMFKMEKLGLRFIDYSRLPLPAKTLPEAPELRPPQHSATFQFRKREWVKGC